MDIDLIKYYTQMYISSLSCDKFYDEDDKSKQYERLSKAEDLSKCVRIINKGNRFDYLDFLYNQEIISEQECADEVYSIWTMQERFHNCGMSKTRLIKFMKLAQKDFQTQEKINALDDVITIYRGVKENSHKGLSWTLSKDTAIWFAKRPIYGNDKNGYVFSGTINKADVLAMFNNRNENEVVCDYRKVRNIECEKIALED